MASRPIASAYETAMASCGLVAVVFLISQAFLSAQWPYWAVVVGVIAVLTCAVSGTIEGIAGLVRWVRMTLWSADR